MPRTCTICHHPQRDEIDQDLVAGQPFRHIAARTGTSTAALQRHKQGHIPLALTKAKEAHEIVQADALLDQIRELQARAVRILEKAERAGDLRTALQAIGQARSVLELQAKVTSETTVDGERGGYLGPTINLNNVIALPKVGAGVPREEIKRLEAEVLELEKGEAVSGDPL